MCVFSFVLVAVILKPPLVLPKVDIFEVYLTLASFPSGWELACIPPGANAWESMPSQPVGEEVHGTGSLLLYSLCVPLFVRPACWT